MISMKIYKQELKLSINSHQMIRKKFIKVVLEMIFIHSQNWLLQNQKYQKAITATRKFAKMRIKNLNLQSSN